MLTDAGSRCVIIHFHDFSCRTNGQDSYGRGMKNLELFYDSEVCSGAP